MVALACTAFVIFTIIAIQIGSADAPPEIPCTVGDETFQVAVQRLSDYQHIVSEIDTGSELLKIEEENSVFINERIGGLDAEATQLWGSRLPFEEIVDNYSQVLVEQLHWSHREMNISYSDWQESFSPDHEFHYRLDKDDTFDHYISAYISFRKSPPTDVIKSEYQTYYQLRYDYSQNPC